MFPFLAKFYSRLDECIEKGSYGCHITHRSLEWNVSVASGFEGELKKRNLRWYEIKIT